MLKVKFQSNFFTVFQSKERGQIKFLHSRNLNFCLWLCFHYSYEIAKPSTRFILQSCYASNSISKGQHIFSTDCKTVLRILHITDLKSSKRSFCEGRPIHQRCVFKPKGRLKRCLVNLVWIRIFVVWVFPNSILSLIQMYCEGSARNSQWIVSLTTLSNQLPGKFSVSE